MSSLYNPGGSQPRRAVRIANCSGANCDPGIHMFNQAKYGNPDVITGDYLAEINLAKNAEAKKSGSHPGYEPTALDGLTLSLDLIYEKRIKVVINGGALDPEALAQKTLEMIKHKRLDLSVAYVSGDDLMDVVLRKIDAGESFNHLDAANDYLSRPHESFLRDPRKTIVTAHAYLGARAIRKGLDEGADIVICGRVSDASPVIGAAQWWHSWSETAYDELAGALIAGHLIECSTYVTGGNFAGFDKYPIEAFLDMGLGIAEIDHQGHCVITKADALGGIVTADTVICQLLYELQGNIYLHSDVKADITDVDVQPESNNRVHVSGVKGFPPPPTTKLAVFYRGGYRCEMTVNASGYATERKFQLQEAQMRHKLKELGLHDAFETLEFQRCGVPETHPRSQLASTTYLRIFGQAAEPAPLGGLVKVFLYYIMQQFSGGHFSLDLRTAQPIPFLAFYPATVPQSLLSERVHFLPSPSSSSSSRSTTTTTTTTFFAAGHPPAYEDLAPRLSYDPSSSPAPASFGPTRTVPLGDVALARSGDKGANVDIGLFVSASHPRADEAYGWLAAYLTRDRIKELMCDDWRDGFVVERVEFRKVRAVHFVIYGVLGRGVGGSSRLDGLGKGFADFIRARLVDVPERFLVLDGARL